MDRLRDAWDRTGFGIYIGLAVLMAIGFGFSICSMMAQNTLLELDARYREEIAKERQYLRNSIQEKNVIIAKQSDQLAAMGVRSAEATGKVTEVLKNQIGEKAPQ